MRRKYGVQSMPFGCVPGNILRVRGDFLAMLLGYIVENMGEVLRSMYLTGRSGIAGYSQCMVVPIQSIFNIYCGFYR